MEKNEILPTLIELITEVTARNRITAAQNEMPRLLFEWRALSNQNPDRDLYKVEEEIERRRMLFLEYDDEKSDG
jgi:hypothetical protein